MDAFIVRSPSTSSAPKNGICGSPKKRRSAPGCKGKNCYVNCTIFLAGIQYLCAAWPRSKKATDAAAFAKERMFFAREAQPTRRAEKAVKIG
jgi:hypothetical protein